VRSHHFVCCKGFLQTLLHPQQKDGFKVSLCLLKIYNIYLHKSFQKSCESSFFNSYLVIFFAIVVSIRSVQNKTEPEKITGSVLSLLLLL